MMAGAVAPRGGARFPVDLRDLSLPRPGVAHRTVYRVITDVSVNLGESFSLSHRPFTSAPRDGWIGAATIDAPLTGEATSGGQTNEARMTVPRSCGELCLISSTLRLPPPFPSYTDVLTKSVVIPFHMRDFCDCCRQYDARWIVLDDKEHVYWEFYLTRRLKSELRRRVQQDAYFACEQCRRHIERQNASSRRPRRLRFLRWS